MKIENPRTDVITRKQFPKNELHRLVLTPVGVKLDPTGKLPGRGVYFHGGAEELTKANAKRLFRRAFRRDLAEEELQEIALAL